MALCRWHFFFVITGKLTRFLNRAEVVSFRSFPRSLLPSFPPFVAQKKNQKKILKIEKFLEKWITHPFLRRACSKNMFEFSKKKFVVPAFRRPHFFSKKNVKKNFLKIEKFLQKWIPHPQKSCVIFPKKIRRSCLPLPKIFLNPGRQKNQKKSQNWKIPAYLNSPTPK